MEDSERRKAIELMKEMRSENKSADDKSANQETHLKWMYKGPSDLIDKEEYLLGKPIDKNFEVLNSGDIGSSDIGRTGEQSNVPKRLLERTDSLEQVDIAKKILEDPLYAIKQKEMEARKKLLNNPVKLKQIKQMLLERNKQNSSHKLKKKKKKSRQKSEQELNILILKKLQKFTDKEKRKALNKVLKSEVFSDSSASSSTDNKKHKKLKVKKKRSHSSSDEYDSSSDSSSSSSEKFSKKKRKKSESNKKKRSKKKEESSSDSSSSSSDNERTKNSEGKIAKERRNFKKSVDSDNRNSTADKKVRKSQEESLRSSKNFTSKSKKRDFEENDTKNRERKKISRGKRDSFSDEERKFKKNYGLTVLDGSKPEKRKREFPVEKHQKSAAESKTKHVPPPKMIYFLPISSLSDKEREEKLREMMENAKLRKEDREKNLANHRKKQSLEEQSKTYDDDFMRRQMSHLTSSGTMADRIKSNINNIQRSKSSMDMNFVRK